LSRYIRIASKFWTDEKVIKLSEEEKFLLLYIYTSPHSNMIGFYILPKLYVMHDLGWSEERFTKPFTKLLAKGFIYYHEDTSVVLIPNFLKYNPIQNKNQAIGAAKALQELPDNPLFPRFWRHLKRFAKPFTKLFAERLPERFGNTETETETGSGTETETTTTDTKSNLEGTAKPPEESEVSRSSRIFKFFEENIGLLSPLVAEKLDYWIDDTEEALVLYALEKAVLAGKRNFSYTEGILKNWTGQGIRTRKEAEIAEQEFRRQKEHSQQPPPGAAKKREPPLTPEEKKRIEKANAEIRKLTQQIGKEMNFS